MEDYEDDYWEYPEEEKSPDLVEEQAVAALRTHFDANKDRVFTSRQIEILFEDTYFHWITHRAIRRLAEEGSVVLLQRQLSYGAPINLLWHRSKRYTTREA